MAIASASALGLLTAIAGTAAVAGGVTAAAIGASKKPKRPTVPAGPTVPDPAVAEEEAKQASLGRRRRRKRFGQTIFTSPAGAEISESQVGKKQLLGE